MTFAEHIEACRICNAWDWCPDGSALLREELFQSAERQEAREEISMEENNV